MESSGGEDDLPEMTVKLTLPKSWQQSGFDRLKKTFITSYNKKHGKELVPGEWHLESSENEGSVPVGHRPSPPEPLPWSKRP